MTAFWPMQVTIIPSSSVRIEHQLEITDYCLVVRANVLINLQVLVSVITAYIVFGDKLSSRVSVAVYIALGAQEG